MTVPSRREATSLLRSLEPPPWHLRHVCAVADVAAFLARRAAARGLLVDALAAETAALLHDVDKLPATGAPAHLRHGDGSAAWLAARGYGELAEIVRDHPVTRLAGDDDRTRLAAATVEAKIVAYADKRAGQQLESMDDRFDSWRRRYPAGPVEEAGPAASPAQLARSRGSSAPGGADAPPTGRGWDDAVAAAVVDRARALEAEVCALAGVRPDEVRRLRWSRRALREARR